ncbi:SO1C1 protein, partial [Nycticryphes semicollaris]|nr:SO1C1 protein [Nycticryphes semicollaris]
PLSFRCVQPELKALAVGLCTLIMRVLAGIPAPVYFGALIDKTCLKWGSTSCGQRGACRLYDSDAYRYVFLGLAAVLRGPSYIFSIIFYILIKKHFQNKNSTPIENGGREDAPINKEDNCKAKECLPGYSDAETESCI